MPFDLFIFDFDGTLVDSVAAKCNAFYGLFPSECDSVVSAVLAEDPEGSRQRVIAEMLRRLGRAADELPAAIERYTALTDEAVGGAAEYPGASATLAALRRAGKLVYVSSNTPESALRPLLERRGWLAMLNGASGHPQLKASTARRLIDTHRVDPSCTAVIGDGESDRLSAEAVGAKFFAVREPADLRRWGRSWGLDV